MNYQVKGISGYVWGVRECVWVYAGVRGPGLHGYGRVCMDMHWCAHVCWMNFQNFFRRIESLHQRTLIRILYKFLLYKIASKAQIAMESTFSNFFL